MTDEARDIVDWAHFEKSRSELGPGFIRILAYFKEDGVKSIAEIEKAMRDQNTTGLVLPAHTLKGKSRQLGAEPVAKIAELIETTARFCMETHRFPDELVPEVVELRRLFSETIELFEKATNPLMTRDPGGPGRLRAQDQQSGFRPDLGSRAQVPSRNQRHWECQPVTTMREQLSRDRQGFGRQRRVKAERHDGPVHREIGDYAIGDAP